MSTPHTTPSKRLHPWRRAMLACALAWGSGPALAGFLEPVTTMSNVYFMTYTGTVGSATTIPEFLNQSGSQTYTITYVLGAPNTYQPGTWQDANLICMILRNGDGTAEFAWNVFSSSSLNGRLQRVRAPNFQTLLTVQTGNIGGDSSRSEYVWPSLGLRGFGMNPSDVTWATPGAASSDPQPVLAFYDGSATPEQVLYDATDLRAAMNGDNNTNPGPLKNWKLSQGNLDAPDNCLTLQGGARSIDLQLTNTLTSTGPHIAGSTATFDLMVRNLGHGTTQPEIVVKDTLPAGLEFVSATGTDWTCSAEGQEVTCTRSATAKRLTGGAAADAITVTAKVLADAKDTLVNVAYVIPASNEVLREIIPFDYFNPYDVASNNNASAALVVPPTIDLMLAKSLTSSGPYAAGSTATFTLLASNLGPGTAQPAIVVSDTLPAGLEFVSATGTDWTCSAAGQVVTCTRSSTAAPLASGSAASAITLTARVRAGATGTLSSVAFVSPAVNETLVETILANGYDDGNPVTGSNNDASAAVTVAAASTGGVQAVPTLGEWGLLLMGLLAAGLGARSLRNPR